jgi:hypothetical protein
MHMSVDLATALAKVEPAAGEIFDADPTVRSVGVGRVGDGYGYIAVRNVRAILPLTAHLKSVAPTSFEGIPVMYSESHADPEQLARLPYAELAQGDGLASHPEREAHALLSCGLQIQNYDDDMRSGTADRGYITIGTLGCFGRRATGEIVMLTNNHVAAGQNRGLVGQDRICQPGTIKRDDVSHVATLSGFVALKESLPGATVKQGTAVLNELDAAVASLGTGVAYSQAYLAGRGAQAPIGVAEADEGDKVYKVGRTTGLTTGTVAHIGAIMGPVPYDVGPCWFRHCIVIVGDNGTIFSDRGDSGSAVVRADGMVLGLLYAGNGTQTYACPISEVLAAFDCSLLTQPA